MRNAGGALCGYVGVLPGHPAHGKGYDSIDADISVHGGLTFSGACHPDVDESAGVCHVAAPGAPEPWWLGFDCAQLMRKALECLDQKQDHATMTRLGAIFEDEWRESIQKET